MRLTEQEAAAIRAAASDAFGAGAGVRLFGSRLDDTRRGGDINLLVQLSAPPTAQAASVFRRLLGRTVGEREYDILVSVGQPVSPVELKAAREGVVL